MRYTKSMIRSGMYMQLECPIRTYIPRARAPQYGDSDSKPDIKAISDRLDAARRKLETIVKDFRNARSR